MSAEKRPQGLTLRSRNHSWQNPALPLQRPSGLLAAPVALKAASRPGGAADESTYLQTHRFFGSNSPWNTRLTGSEQLSAVPGIGGYATCLTSWVPTYNSVAIIYAHQSDPMVEVEYNPDAWTNVSNGTWARFNNSPGIEQQIRATSSPIVPFPGNPYSTQVVGRYWSSTPSGLPVSYDAWHQTAPLYIHVPVGALPTPGWDGNTAIIQPDGTAVEMYAPIKMSDGTWVAMMYSVTNALTGQGVGAENGRTASMIENYAGVLRDMDVTSGTISHALAITVPASMLAQGFIGPALAFDSNSSNYSGTLPMGSHLALPLDLPLGSLGLETPLGLEMAKAAQSYGMFIVDQGGGGISVVTQDAPKSAALTTWSPAEQHDLDVIFKNTMLVHG